MKIIHFISSIDRTAGGTTIYMQLLASELKNHSELVVVAGISSDPVELKETNVQFFDLRLKRWLKIQKEFSQFLKDEKPDIVHINGIWTPQNWLFQKEAQKLGIQVVLSPHGMLQSYILKRHPFKKKVAMFLYQDNALHKANYLHATAQEELNQIYNLGYHSPAIIISNGINLSEVLVKTEWPKDRIQNILFLGRVHLQKGIEILIDSVALLKPNHVKFIIAGEGEPDYIIYLINQCKQKGIDHLFDFIGGVYGSHKWQLYQQADLFILPTYSENFGIVVAEALATGIPVITSTGTPWQELQTKQCGWWIDLSVENLAKTLKEALSTDTQKLEQMGKNGQRLIEEKYSIKQVSSKMIDFYKSIFS